MQKIDRRIDVTAAAKLGEPVEMAVSIYLPDLDRLPEKPVAIFACPGGGYSRHYFDMHFAGHENYSEAEYHVSRGTIYFTIDHVGVAESTLPEARIEFETLADTHDSCVRQLLADLRAGTLAPGFPAVSPFAVGMGQSLGGGVTIITQGRHATFDAIAPFGKSAIHTALPQRNKEEFELGVRRFDAVKQGLVTKSDELDQTGIDYVYPFHWEDIPADILALDTEGGYPLRTHAPYFASATLPQCSVRMMLPGILTEDAARISVPVMIGVGERDTCPEPLKEPAAYPLSRDVMVCIVPTMAHMHNFAGTRERLWRRFHAWTRMLAEG